MSWNITAVTLKETLSHIKETLLDDASEGSATPESATASAITQALLCLECAQRGVLVSYDSDPNSVILEAVRATAGKPLLNEASAVVFGLPKPLLSGLSVIQGRLAEALSQSMNTQTAQSPSSLASFDSKLLGSVLRRCQDVSDARLECLMHLLLAMRDTRTATLTLQQQQTLVRVVAEGCYYRAADFAPDAPPLWKRIVDLHTDRMGEETTSGHATEINWRAFTALETMQSIASSKGNVKRAQELSLMLAECIMTTDEFAVSASSIDDSFSSLAKSFLQTFVASYRPLEPYAMLLATQKASEYLQQAQSKDQLEAGAPSDQRLRLSVLALRIALGTEQASIQQAAENEYTAARNRASSVVSRVQVYNQVRQKLLVSTALDWDGSMAELHSHAIHLRDEILVTLSRGLKEPDGAETMNILECQALTVMHKYLVRAQEQAKALAANLKSDKGGAVRNALKHSWRWLQELAIPLMENTLSQSQGYQSDGGTQGTGPPATTGLIEWICTLTPKHYELLQQSCFCIIFCEWMLSSEDPSSSALSKPLLLLLRDVLQAMVAQEEEKAREGSHEAILSGNASRGSLLRRVECALRSTKAWIHLTVHDSKTNAACEISQCAVSKSDDMGAFGESVAEFGMSYLEFLVCWSGLFNEAWAHCSITEAKQIVAKARTCIDTAVVQWGRTLLADEAAVLHISLADAEVGSANCMHVYKEYIRVERKEEKEKLSPTEFAWLLECLCVFRLSKYELQNADDVETLYISVNDVQSRLDMLKKAKQPNSSYSDGPLYLWREDNATSACVEHLVSVGRQIAAEIFLGSNRASEAQRLLELAVIDSPSDSAALFSLGCFHLRMLFFSDETSTNKKDRSKIAQAYLLKAAKADPSKASPFALLGYWYENANDIARASGCYSKALLLDPSHPVAGRGISRLNALESLKSIVESATSENSAYNGWAWWALGQIKMNMDGNDELAVVAFVAALRCRDIVRPQSDSLSFFYNTPDRRSWPCSNEYVAVLTALATCYRRSGRYTASLRCYESAIDASGNTASSSLLCSCAEVAFELGLLEEASEKFARALDTYDDASLLMASFGLSLTLLSVAKRDMQDGKSGAAFDAINRGISICLTLNCDRFCIFQLLGDLHSFAAKLPPSTFRDSCTDESLAVSSQIEFVSKGVDHYRTAEKIVAMALPEETSRKVLACVASDIGCNYLSQAHLLDDARGEGLGQSSPDVEGVLQLAADAFLAALKICPDSALAWCGLGCANSRSNPLLAQHAFCRSMELDSLLPESYTNLAFLYTMHNVPDASEKMSDAVTKVADTPYMWINRAFLAGQEANSRSCFSKADSMIQQSADAYRAALQVSSISVAQEGLALTCRVGRDTKRFEAEMNYLLSEFVASSGIDNIPAIIFHGLSVMELHSDACRREDRKQIVEALNRLEEAEGSPNLTIGSLHIDAIFATISEPKRHESSAPRIESSRSDVRQLFCSPDRGDLWLALVKQYLRHNETTTIGLESVRLAMRKGLCVLTEAATRNQTTAENLADGLALEYWLEHLLLEKGGEPNPVRLQKSLLLDPSNSFARAAMAGESVA